MPVIVPLPMIVIVIMTMVIMSVVVVTIMIMIVIVIVCRLGGTVVRRGPTSTAIHRGQQSHENKDECGTESQPITIGVHNRHLSRGAHVFEKFGVAAIKELANTRVEKSD